MGLDELRQTVVDFRIDVVGSSRQQHAVDVVLRHEGQRRLAGPAHIALVMFPFLVGGVDGGGPLGFGNVFIGHFLLQSP